MKFPKIRSHVSGTLSAAVAALALWALPQQAQAQEPILGEVRLFGFNWCPRGWSSADGQLLDIASHTALFSLYGTIYGGDGRTTFKLPDLRGRAPISQGIGPGLPDYRIGQPTGATAFTIDTNHMPSHRHILRGSQQGADQHGPGGDIFGAPYYPDSQTKLNHYRLMPVGFRSECSSRY